MDIWFILFKYKIKFSRVSIIYDLNIISSLLAHLTTFIILHAYMFKVEQGVAACYK